LKHKGKKNFRELDNAPKMPTEKRSMFNEDKGNGIRDDVAY